MNKKTKILIVIASCALLFGGFSIIRSFLIHDEFLGPADNFVTKVDFPLTLEQARKHLTFPLPDEATDIYYAHYAQWIAYDFMVKFTAPFEQCKSHAIYLIEKYNEENPDRKMPSELTIIAELPLPEDTSDPINITWFDVHNIKNGFIIATGGSLQPTIWIDADRNTFYYRLMD